MAAGDDPNLCLHGFQCRASQNWTWGMPFLHGCYELTHAAGANDTACRPHNSAIGAIRPFCVRVILFGIVTTIPIKVALRVGKTALTDGTPRVMALIRIVVVHNPD